MGLVPSTAVLGFRFNIVGPGTVMLNPPVVPPVDCESEIVVEPGPNAIVFAAESEKEIVLGEALTLMMGLGIKMDAFGELIVTLTFDAKFVPEMRTLLVVLYCIVEGEMLLMDGGPVGVGGAIVKNWTPVFVVATPLFATICQ